jgi:hypothetical protein
VGASEGVFQVERQVKTGADLNFDSGPRYHPGSLRAVLYKADAGAVTVFVEMVDGDRVYLIDTAVGVSDYSWPNADSPEKFDFVPPQRVRFRTTGIGAGKHSAAVTWAELGV